MSSVSGSTNLDRKREGDGITSKAASPKRAKIDYSHTKDRNLNREEAPLPPVDGKYKLNLYWWIILLKLYRIV